MKFNYVIVRFGGEIGIKGKWTRRTYEKLLLKNIKKALGRHGISHKKIKQKSGRIYIKTKNAQETASKLTRVFGVSSVSPAIEITAEMSEIVEKAVELATKMLKSGSSFAVRCHRVGEHSYSSMDVCKEAGKQILANLKNRNLKVDLRNPRFTIKVEVRDDHAYIHTETFVRESPRKLTCILCKRMMYRIAERIADTEKADDIIIGESIGEQASQTLHNLRVLNEAAGKCPVHRPLLGFNKLETEGLAKKIGTFEIPTRKTEGCGAAPRKPATKARLENVKKAEEQLDIEGMVEESVREAKIVTV